MTNSQAVATRYLQRPEGRIAYDVTGSGPLVVAVPGMGDLRSTFRDLAPALVGAGFRVATTDVRGHGESDTSFTRHGDAATAEDVLALIRELGGPALIVGNSFAGSAAVIAAGTEPELVAGTALISPFLREPGPAGVARTAVHALYAVMFAQPWGAGAWTGYFAKTLNRGAKAPWFDEHVADIRASLAAPDRIRSFRRLALQLDHSIVEPYVEAAAAVPSLTIVGALDPDYKDPAAELEYMGGRLGGRTLLVPDAAHYAHTQQAATVVPAIVGFAEGLRSADRESWASRA
jgi:pimeloyl-ACP methyl ester carboxylesterase